MPANAPTDTALFLDRADADAVPRTLGEINEWQHDIFKRGYAPEALNAGALRRRLIAALNIEFLVDGLDERPLTVTTVAATRSGDGETRELIFSDPFVGDFRALLVAPVPARRKSPAIIALHGHFDAPETFFDQFFGKRLVAEGIAVLVLSSRALGGAPHEPETVLRFLHRGFHVLGLHVYETLLAHKYLSFLSLLPNGPVDAEAIGLLGHSSGSTTANIALRLLRGKIRAYAGDQITEYLGVYPVSAANENSVFVTQAPPLFPYSRAVNDFSTAGADVLMLPYGFRDGDLSYENEVVSFFASKLTGR
ncbi:MAG: hypothetical protein M5R36_06705 [Deltaproteobacteria bacterium]|nr:hypothetical protein [Deltaproteobacteria bacterium]